MGLSGQVIKSWEYQFELDLIDEYQGGNVLLDANLTYRPSPLAWIRVGAQKVPFSRTMLVSSANTQFIERPAWVGMEVSVNERCSLDRIGRAIPLSLNLTDTGSIQYYSQRLTFLPGLLTFS